MTAGPVPGEPGSITVNEEGNLVFENISMSIEAQNRLTAKVTDVHYTHCYFYGSQ